jgi:DNA topoisomerase I
VTAEVGPLTLDDKWRADEATITPPKNRTKDAVLDEAAFKEEEHPRAENGQFGSGAGGGSSASLKSYASKEDWPAHVKALKLPPAWTDVKVASDPDAALQAVGKDAKGRAQYVYSAKFAETQAALKFDRIASLAKDMPMIDGQLAKQRKSKDDRTRNHADCMTLVRTMGLRPGDDADTKAKVKAYGASNLEGRHVVVKGNEVRLQFTGKKGVAIDIPVTDAGVSKNLRERAAGAGTDGRLFPGVTGASLLDTAHGLDHGGYKTKDFRTRLATDTAASLVSQGEPPRDAKEYKRRVLEVAKQVSSKLGNTPTVALQSYIAPQTFAGWRQAAGA